MGEGLASEAPRGTWRVCQP